MIDLVTVFTKGGLVLWTHRKPALKESPVNALIEKVLMSDKSGESVFPFEEYSVKWAFANELNLVFVVAFLNFSSLFSIDEFMQDIKFSFCKAFGENLHCTKLSNVPSKVSLDFDEMYQRIEAKHRKLIIKQSKASKDAPKVEEDLDENQQSSLDVSEVEENLKKLKLKGRKGKKQSKQSEVKSKKGKERRDWVNLGIIDKTKAKPTESRDYDAIEQIDIERVDSEDEYEAEDTSDTSGILGYLSTIVSGKRLTESDLESSVQSMHQSLISKNVAVDITDQICNSVRQSLIGQSISSFASCKSLVKKVRPVILSHIYSQLNRR